MSFFKKIKLNLKNFQKIQLSIYTCMRHSMSDIVLFILNIFIKIILNDRILTVRKNETSSCSEPPSASAIALRPYKIQSVTQFV